MGSTKGKHLRIVSRPAVVFFFSIAFAGVLAALLMDIALPPPPPPSLPSVAPLGPALTHHLALIVVDGLRYDLATDATVMPAFAQRMQRESHGEIWSSPISVTASAVLAYGTGQRGELDQVANDERGSPVLFANVPASVRAAGLTTAVTGAHPWFHLYPDGWTEAHPDPSVGIDVDYDAEIFAAAREMASRTPAFLVAHFVMPDHQGHRTGTASPEYREFLRTFDRDLAALLTDLPPDWTVFVTSDHGARADGQHGWDTPEQRRSPLYAYGPGIVHGRAEQRPLDQIDLATMFAVLLGVSPPATSRGHLLAEWLDVTDTARAQLACADLARLFVYARQVASERVVLASGAEQACLTNEPRQRVQAARSAAQLLDRAIGEARPSGVLRGSLVLLFAVLGALVIVWLTVRPMSFAVARATAIGIVLAALGTAIIFALDFPPGAWQAVGVAALAVSLNGALIGALTQSRRALAWLAREPWLGALLLPGLLVATSTWSLRGEAFGLAALIAIVPMITDFSSTPAKIRWQVPKRAVATLGLLFFVSPLAFVRDAYLPDSLMARPDLLLGLAVASMVLFSATRFFVKTTKYQVSALAVVSMTALAVASLVLRRFAPAAVCITGWLGCAIAVPLVWRRGSWLKTAAPVAAARLALMRVKVGQAAAPVAAARLALTRVKVSQAAAPVAAARLALTRVKVSQSELLALASYSWVSRDAEIPALLLTYVVASLVGETFAQQDRDAQKPLHPAAVLALVTFLFAWIFIQRIGVQLGVEFTSLDFGAGSFREAGAPMWRLVSAVCFKHALAVTGLVFAVLTPLRKTSRVSVARGLVIAEAARAAVLTAHLLICRGSFWTSLHALGDLPHALLALVVAAGAWWVVARANADSSPLPS